ncbi:MAG: phosphatase PAP2 family protein [Bacteroidetes bacterium]|nr:phosphatase PAP2 family protein [Bacteroidota bacterium]
MPLFLAASVVIFCTQKLSLHLFFNQYVGGAFDVFFKYLTYLGDGIFVIPFCLLFMLFYNIKKSMLLSISYIVSSVITQIFKSVYSFFFQNDRPAFVFEQQHVSLKRVPDVALHIIRSFPSGHATAAFSLFFCLSFFTKNRKIQVLYFFIAVLTAFSRVYLSQHFFEDITAGSFIGVLFSWCTCAYFQSKWSALNKPVFSLF